MMARVHGVRLARERLRRWPSGQALVLALFLLVAGVAALLRLFDTGQLVHERARLTQAADAAAYSGALAVARALNLQAYANRTQIAHQVAMAHLVTLASASRFVATEGTRASLGNPPASVIGLLFGPQHGAAYLAARAGAGMDAVAQQGLRAAFDAHDRLVHEVLWRTQQAVAATLPATRWAAMQAVLKANDTLGAAPAADAAQLDPVFLADTLPGFIGVYAGASRARLAGLVREATAHYGFLDPRNHTARNAWLVSPRCPWRRHELRRRGETALEGNDTWTSDDTQSYHALRSNRWIGCYFREYPMGWADAAAQGRPPAEETSPGVDAPADFSAQDFWRWAQANTDWDIFNGTSNPLANAYARASRIRWQSRGLPGFVDISTRAAQDASGVRFAVRVWRGAGGLAVTGAASQVRVGPGPLRGNARLPGDALAVVSAAQTFFERPQARQDGAEERPSLYQPYWQARRVSVTAQERALARERQGLGAGRGA